MELIASLSNSRASHLGFRGRQQSFHSPVRSDFGVLGVAKSARRAGCLQKERDP